ncbi:MAG: ABC transporter ATP-binding protein [Bacteroidetes bacterium]|nr:ABC transporter ATP-binding protein [Bacteroidota bacterium]
MPEEIIQVNHVSKNFKDIIAVNDLSFTVLKNDVYGFLGQNGAGKSTMIRMLLTLIRPSSGEINIFGKQLATHRIESLKRMGAIIEKPDVYKYLSAFQNLALFAKLSGMRPSKSLLMDALKQVGLQNREHDLVKTFSQGMKQRLGIAIALIHEPDIIILDEPTNGLDPQGIADMRKMISYLQQERKKTVLVSSHLLSEIEQIATRILIIDKGKKLIEGEASTLLDPSNTMIEIKALKLEEALAKLRNSQWESLLVPGDEHSIKLKMSKNLIPKLHQWLVQNNVDIISMIPRHSLEDLFLQVTSGKNNVESI